MIKYNPLIIVLCHLTIISILFLIEYLVLGCTIIICVQMKESDIDLSRNEQDNEIPVQNTLIYLLTFYYKNISFLGQAINYDSQFVCSRIAANSLYLLSQRLSNYILVCEDCQLHSCMQITTRNLCFIIIKINFLLYFENKINLIY